ncbi:MAG TPA: MafI family immunity protein [Candidatus Limnocylindrales bacterium]|nr:MafI family immunity protein [Candidatus Limnocylindrales bacterium]
MEVTAEFHGLILSSRGALSENEVREVQEFIDGLDFNLALETLCGFLVEQNRRVTPDLYVRIHSLCERLDGVDPYLLESVKAIVVER